MNQMIMLRESRSKHTLRSYKDAVQQLRAFATVLPISEKNAKSSSNTRVNKTVTVCIDRKQ